MAEDTTASDIEDELSTFTGVKKMIKKMTFAQAPCRETQENNMIGMRDDMDNFVNTNLAPSAILFIDHEHHN